MKKYLILFLTSVLALTVAAQETGVSSPYSRYGVGLLSDRASGFNTGMAGTGIAFSDGRRLNFTNPASYAYIDSLSFLFDVGLTLQNEHRATGGAAYNARRTQFDYLAAGFRLMPRLGFSVGLRPFSNVGYELNSAPTVLGADNGSNGTTSTTNYTGDGGLHLVYAGVAYMPLRGLALGVNAGYLWGTTTHTTFTRFNSAAVSSLRRVYAYEVRSYTLDFGASFARNIHRNHKLSLGLTYAPGHNLHGSAELYNQRINGSTIAGGDTLSVDNAFSLPSSFGVGLAWEYKSRLRVGVDYTLQQWSKSTGPTQPVLPDGRPSFVKTKGIYDDRHRWSLGAEYTPDPDALSWAPRIRYRVGLSYTSPYAKVDGLTGPTAYGATLGVGLPIITARNNRTTLNIAARYEYLKPSTTGGLKEQFLGISLGLSFGEKWFEKWKVD